ncbi:hypothetical protein DDE74_30600 [Streptomyces lydicus]|uniref:Uncharacterized protein n=1 Tax=Streptomyces lydicus TaxID=47763 RepID=A0A3Q9KDG5_9ACTN|nr:hypothetical protein DDE74_30600 [Streptomyces lydicus]
MTTACSRPTGRNSRACGRIPGRFPEAAGFRPRYRLLETVAAYCLERLRVAGELTAVCRNHHRHYTELAERAAPLLYGPDQREWRGGWHRRCW